MPTTFAQSVATDDGKRLEITINNDTGQLFIAVSEAQRPPRHIATLNRKSKVLDNLIGVLLEASEHLQELAPAAAVTP